MAYSDNGVMQKGEEISVKAPPQGGQATTYNKSFVPLLDLLLGEVGVLNTNVI